MASVLPKGIPAALALGAAAAAVALAAADSDGWAGVAAAGAVFACVVLSAVLAREGGGGGRKPADAAEQQRADASALPPLPSKRKRKGSAAAAADMPPVERAYSDVLASLASGDLAQAKRHAQRLPEAARGAAQAAAARMAAASSREPKQQQPQQQQPQLAPLFPGRRELAVRYLTATGWRAGAVVSRNADGTFVIRQDDGQLSRFDFPAEALEFQRRPSASTSASTASKSRSFKYGGPVSQSLGAPRPVRPLRDPPAPRNRQHGGREPPPEYRVAEPAVSGTPMSRPLSEETCSETVTEELSPRSPGCDHIGVGNGMPKLWNPGGTPRVDCRDDDFSDRPPLAWRPDSQVQLLDLPPGADDYFAPLPPFTPRTGTQPPVSPRVSHMPSPRPHSTHGAA